MEKKEIKSSKYVAAVVMAYDGLGKLRGDVISKHKSFEAAEKAANKSTFYAVKAL